VLLLPDESCDILRSAGWFELLILDLADLASPNLFPFAYLKSVLQGRHFEKRYQLFAAITHLMGSIEKVTLERVLLEWMDRLAKCLSPNGDFLGEHE
jgi:hypothetical protein